MTGEHWLLLNCSRLFGPLSQTVLSNQSSHLCIKLGQSQSWVAMVRDCLHPLMLLAMWALAHITACSFVCAQLVSVDPSCWQNPPIKLVSLCWAAHFGSYLGKITSTHYRICTSKYIFGLHNIFKVCFGADISILFVVGGQAKTWQKSGVQN